MKNDGKEIRELIQTWMAATKSGDIERVLSLMAEDAVFVVAGRDPFGKEEFRKNSERLAADSIKFDGKSEIIELEILGDWAFAISQLSVVTSEPGKPKVSRSGNTLTIFRKENGKWLLARDANLLTPDSE